ncbi:hypothetical protein ALC57_02776, partial [Trachymyrmex cornetzi]
YASPQPCRLLPILIVVERVSAQGRDRWKTLKILLEKCYFATRLLRRRVTGSTPRNRRIRDRVLVISAHLDSYLPLLMDF